MTAAIDDTAVESGTPLFFTGDDADAEAAAFPIAENLAAAALEALPRN